MAITTTGKMNERIYFWNKENVKNPDTGSNSVKLVFKDKLWCAVKTQYLSELQARVGTKYEDTITFVLRDSKKSRSIQMEWTLKYRDKEYQIIDINPDPENNNFLLVIAKRK